MALKLRLYLLSMILQWLFVFMDNAAPMVVFIEDEAVRDGN